MVYNQNANSNHQNNPNTTNTNNKSVNNMQNRSKRTGYEKKNEPIFCSEQVSFLVGVWALPVNRAPRVRKAAGGLSPTLAQVVFYWNHQWRVAIFLQFFYLSVCVCGCVWASRVTDLTIWVCELQEWQISVFECVRILTLLLKSNCSYVSVKMVPQCVCVWF